MLLFIGVKVVTFQKGNPQNIYLLKCDNLAVGCKDTYPWFSSTFLYIILHHLNEKLGHACSLWWASNCTRTCIQEGAISIIIYFVMCACSVILNWICVCILLIRFQKVVLLFGSWYAYHKEWEYILFIFTWHTICNSPILYYFFRIFI